MYDGGACEGIAETGKDTEKIPDAKALTGVLFIQPDFLMFQQRQYLLQWLFE